MFGLTLTSHQHGGQILSFGSPVGTNIHKKRIPESMIDNIKSMTATSMNRWCIMKADPRFEPPPRFAGSIRTGLGPWPLWSSLQSHPHFLWLVIISALYQINFFNVFILLFNHQPQKTMTNIDFWSNVQLFIEFQDLPTKNQKPVFGNFRLFSAHI